MRRQILVTTVALAAALTLVGCGAPAKKAAPKPPADGGTYSSVDDLRKAFVKAGGDCDDWEQTDQVRSAAESGNCSTSNVLSTYASESAKDQGIATLKSLSGMGIEVSLLTGKNWIINDPDAASYRKKLGGIVVKVPAK